MRAPSSRALVLRAVRAVCGCPSAVWAAFFFKRRARLLVSCLCSVRFACVLFVSCVGGCAPRLGLRFAGRVGGALLPAPLRFAEARAPLVASAAPALRAPPLCGFARPRPRPPSPRVRLVCLPSVGVCFCGAPRGLRFGAGSFLCVRVVCFAFALFVCCVTLRPALCLCALRARCSRLSVRGCLFAVVCSRLSVRGCPSAVVPLFPPSLSLLSRSLPNECLCSRLSVRGCPSAVVPLFPPSLSLLSRSLPNECLWSFVCSRSCPPAPALALVPRAPTRPRSFLARSLARSASLHSRGALRLTADLR